MNALSESQTDNPGPSPGVSTPARPDLLSHTTAFWLLVALVGQWAFLYYISAFYGASIFSGTFEVWNRFEAFGSTLYVAGDTIGNLTFAAHALGAGIVALCGGLQLIPLIRRRAPAFHRWNGRVFLATVVALSLSGFYLVWVRDTKQSVSDISASFNGVLILSFAYLAYRNARSRDLPAHRRWALRLYLVSNAQWFLRIGVFSYFLIGHMLGSNPSFADPFMRFWTFGCYLVPLTFLELYLRAQQSSSRAGRIALAGALVVLALAMGVGIFGFAMFSQKLISGAPLTLPGA